MPQSSSKQFSGIFVSYRRDDSAGHAGRLSDKLSDHFGNDQIFMDIDDIQPGEDFVQLIENAVGSCEILIAIIGRHWLSRAGETSRWLDNPNDFVRLEIAAALNRDIRVIPVLVQRATMPKPQDLPDDLTKLSRRNALELTDTRWQRDVDQLINAIEKIRDEQARRRPALPPGPQPEPIPRPARSNRTLLMVAATFIVVIVLAVVLFIMRLAPPIEPPTSATANITPSTNESKEKPVPPAGMVYVPTEEFMMGRDNGDSVNERPAHRVSVGGFFIDQHEVTCDEYAEFIQTGHPAPPDWVSGNVQRGAERKPVTNVNWDDADAYCNKYGKRLPREEEWEFAARGTKGYTYPWGNVWQAGLANVHTKGLAEVGNSGLSPYGAVDMVGNAWEWTASPLTPYPNGTLSEQPSADWKVIRGGSYIDSPSQATTTYRVGYPARSATDYSKIGFRCVSDATHTSKPR